MPLSESDYIRSVSQMGPEELAAAVAGADAREARVLRIYLGDEQFEEIGRLSSRVLTPRALASRTAVRDGNAPRNVVVLHGIMGGELTLLGTAGQIRIWVQALRLIQGQFSQLGLDAEGRSTLDVIASGMYMRFYGSLLVRLSLGWKVRPFFYDWRGDIRTAADALHQRINSAFGPEEPVHLVAHSMGGLVARSFIARHGERWKKGGRLIMLGTPNYGSFSIPRLLFGTHDVLALVNRIDMHHNLQELLDVVKTFAGMYQMMPAESQLAGLGPLYRTATYGMPATDQHFFDNARSFQSEIADAIDPERMFYIAGNHRLTMKEINDAAQLANDHGYVYGRDGDGTVPHNLGLLPGVPTFYADEEHSKLPSNKDVQQAVLDLLETGSLTPGNFLGTSSLAPRGETAESQTDLLAEEAKRRSTKEQQAVALRTVLVGRGDTRGETVSAEEQLLNDLITRYEPLPQDLAEAAVSGAGAATASQSGTTPSPEALAPRVKLRVRVVESGIQSLARDFARGEAPVDCVSVGHYLRVRPTAAERDLDVAISLGSRDDDLILTQFHDRGILRGDLGVPFFLPDPRPDFEDSLVAIAGLGQTGQLGVPELALAVRELCWSLGRLGKKHLATVLIGSGSKNLSTADAVHAWLLGAQRALASAVGEDAGGLEVLTFALRPASEDAERRMPEMIAALKREAASMSADPSYRFDIELKNLPDVPEKPAPLALAEPAAARISIDFENGQCRYSALTGDASIPERVFEISTQRIDEISRRVLSASASTEKFRLGKFLLDYLFPRDLRDQLSGSAPIVLACNNEAAKVYWELAAQPMEDEDFGPTADQSYLGLVRGLTRQLRTVLAPAPEPPPPPGRLLRVLVVANGCREHPLPGAQEEAQLLLELFDRVNAQNGPDKIHAKALIGPANATALDVLLQINDQPPFDVLHYAGHCVYNKAQPENSGFLFSNGDVLTAKDLDRVDRTPKFVFANACESGVLPSRPDLSSAELPATFAESFFAKGVANFICTAWPVGDVPSRNFALELYRALLGDNPERSVAPLYMALRQARRCIADSHTWAAYQHYGNPYFRMFRSRSKPR